MAIDAGSAEALAIRSAQHAVAPESARSRTRNERRRTLPAYRGVLTVRHEGAVPKDELIQHLAERTVLEVVDAEIEGLQVVILWRSLLPIEEEDGSQC
jgi:hypothetical protein